MRGTILVSHGFFAKELGESLKMIAGEVENMEACCLEKTDGPESFDAKLTEAEKKLEGCDEIVVFADLLGGSPCNTAFQHFMGRDDVQIIAGMNFPMVLTALLTPDMSVEDMIATGQQGVIDVKAFSAAAADDMDD